MSGYKMVAHVNKKRFKNKFNKRRNNLEQQLFSSVNSKYITLACGTQTIVIRGTNYERSLWCVKDSNNSPGSYYYFKSPEEAERTFSTKYDTELKRSWLARTALFVYPDDWDE